MGTFSLNTNLFLALDIIYSKALILTIMSHIIVLGFFCLFVCLLLLPV